MVLPPPTSQVFLTLMILPSNSVPLQTPACSEYHPFGQHRVVSAFSHTRTKLQQHGTNSSLLSVTHPLPVPFKSFLKIFLFSKTFLQSLCPEVPVCVKVCVCVWVGVHVRARAHLFGDCVFEVLTSKYMCVLDL